MCLDGLSEVAWSSLLDASSSDEEIIHQPLLHNLSMGILSLLQGNDHERKDIILFCRRVDGYNDVKEEFINTIHQFQTSDVLNQSKLRTLRLHRVIRPSVASTYGSITYTPRISREAILSSPANVTADVLFIVDFTGSMGSYMRTVKKELESIIKCLQDSTGGCQLFHRP